MKLSISNIAWKQDDDNIVYQLMRKLDFAGLEIAPTRIIPETPYERLQEAKKWGSDLKSRFGFVVPSMQSIWFGRQEKLFGTKKERETLITYTQKAIDFAESIGCKNLVFGCPRNRYKPDDITENAAIGFFRAIGDYAATKNIRIGIEANPVIYNTNYLNTTISAIELIKKVDSNGLGLNLDFGTILENKETLFCLENNVNLISHVHISEPRLEKIQKREQHQELAKILLDNNYQGFISIEMKSGCLVSEIEEIMVYVKETFR